MRAKRRLYKPERAPARKIGEIKAGQWAPVSCPDASPKEIAMALFSVCKEANFKIGRSCEYEALRDEYRVIGKSLESGKAQEITVQGFEVGAVIKMVRNALIFGAPSEPSFV